MDTELADPANTSLEQILRRRAAWVAACVVVFAVLAYGYSKHQTKKYTATAAVAFNTEPLNQQIAGLSGTSNTQGLIAQQTNNRELVKLGDMATETARTVGHGLTAAAVESSVAVSAQGETNIVTVAATSPSPALAAAIANTYVKHFVKEQRALSRAYFRSALRLVQRQLAELPPAQRYGTDGLDLVNRAHTIDLLAGLGYNNVQVAQEASVPTSPSSPKTKTNTLLGAIVGLLAGFGVAFLLERVDKRFRRPEELEAMYGAPVLGAVPKSAALAGTARRSLDEKPLPSAVGVALSLIRAHLRFLNVDRDVRAILVASPASGDGKTTIALGLAEVAARSGGRVLLVEADLRQPSLAQHLDLRTGPGLADVLTGVASTEEAIQSLAIDDPQDGHPSTHVLDVLAAGAVRRHNPAELLESPAMGTIIDQARVVYDFVVVDSTPLTVVSDAFPLLARVDGVVVVGRVGKSRTDAAERLHQVLEASGVDVLGVIANDSKSSGSVAYANRRPARREGEADREVSPEPAAPTAKV